MSNIIATPQITHAGAKQWVDYPIVFKHYQYKDTFISDILYLEGSVAYPSTIVGTATATVQTTNFPISGEVIYHPSHTLSAVDGFTLQSPLVGRRANYTRINATAINGGVKYTVAWDLSPDNWLVVVHKSSTASVSGKVKVRSSVGNESVCAFTTSATTNTWQPSVFQFKTSGATGVTLTGSPVYTTINEVEITLDAISVADIASVYCVNAEGQIIGKISGYSHNCVSEFQFENTLETANLLCGQQVERVTGTGRTFSITVSGKKFDMQAEASSMGTSLESRTLYIEETINSDVVGKKTISAGTVTLLASQNISSVYIDGVQLSRVTSATLVPVGGYHYNSSTGVVTVNTQYNGKLPFVKIWNTGSRTTRTVRNLELGYYGYLQAPRKAEESGVIEYITCEKAMNMLDAETMADDFDSMSVKYYVFPSNGVYAYKSVNL